MDVKPIKAGAFDSDRGQSLVLNGVTVVDTQTGKLMPTVCVVVAKATIQRIVPVGTTIEGNPVIIDMRGKFVVPGYMDMHTHLYQEEHTRSLSAALMLAYGITGIRQMAGTTKMLRARSNGSLTSGEHGPELLSLCGEILLPMNAPTPEAGIREVQRQKAEGADFIKTIFVSPKVFFATLAESKRQDLAYDGHLSPGVDVWRAAREGMSVIEHLGPTELQLIATSTRSWLINFILKIHPPKPPDLSPEAMKKAGKIMIANPIVARLNGDPGGLSKTQRLIDSFSEAKARKLAETFVQHGTWQCLTLIRDATMRLGDDPKYTQSPDLRYVSLETRQFWSQVGQMFSSKMSPASRETLKRLGEMELQLTKIFDTAGVKMMTGSDYGGGWVIPGVSLHQEFDLLADAGLSPLKILQMTTLDGARFLNRTSTIGTVEAAKHANLVVLNRSPLESASSLHDIHAVVRAGVFYSQGDLEAIKEQVAGRLSLPLPDRGDAADTAM